ncbi:MULTISPECIES: sensor histidine kinase [unclassified Empedobacter]|uniref:sensor histidine kinase n=1 Tax=unclassified Empedobacter TaxID=2643773 RepID=UPI0025B825CD|nr:MULTISPECIES: histidine kinase [unclassified Empedobacter]
MNSLLPQSKNQKIINFLVDKKFRFSRHLLFIAGFLLVIYSSAFVSNYYGIYRYYVILLLFVVFVLKTYINIYILVPKFFFKGYYILYLLLLTILVYVGINIIGQSLDVFFGKYRIASPRQFGENIRRGYEGLIVVVPIIMMTTTLKLFQKWIEDSRQISELKNLTFSMEINELKNQINPHFLFNMLNNVKALIRKDPEIATVVIMKLSDFLRYQLYENNEEKTPVSSEIKFLTNFLELEKIRQESLNVSIESEANNSLLNTTYIPPNLFTTFVENAIKHSVNLNDESTYIKIEIAISNDQLHFVCKNSIDPNYIIPNNKFKGLGLPNITRRLELLYEKTYSLKINATNEEYCVNLIIPI